MAAPWSDTATRVVIEFKKSNRGTSRVVELTKDPHSLPPQLYGRIAPEVWAGFMGEVQQLAGAHPYLATPNMNWCCSNAGALACFVAIGFGCFTADAGDYGPWLHQLDVLLARNRQYFHHSGCELSWRRVHDSYWVQVDVNQAVAVGAPAPAAAPQPVYGAPAYGTPVLENPAYPYAK